MKTPLPTTTINCGTFVSEPNQETLLNYLNNNIQGFENDRINGLTVTFQQTRNGTATLTAINSAYFTGTASLSYSTSSLTNLSSFTNTFNTLVNGNEFENRLYVPYQLTDTEAGVYIANTLNLDANQLDFSFSASAGIVYQQTCTIIPKLSSNLYSGSLSVNITRSFTPKLSGIDNNFTCNSQTYSISCTDTSHYALGTDYYGFRAFDHLLELQGNVNPCWVSANPSFNTTSGVSNGDVSTTITFNKPYTLKKLDLYRRYADTYPLISQEAIPHNVLVYGIDENNNATQIGNINYVNDRNVQHQIFDIDNSTSYLGYKIQIFSMWPATYAYCGLGEIVLL